MQRAAHFLIGRLVRRVSFVDLGPRRRLPTDRNAAAAAALLPSLCHSVHWFEFEASSPASEFIRIKMSHIQFSKMPEENHLSHGIQYSVALAFGDEQTGMLDMKCMKSILFLHCYQIYIIFASRIARANVTSIALW